MLLSSFFNNPEKATGSDAQATNAMPEILTGAWGFIAAGIIIGTLDFQFYYLLNYCIHSLSTGKQGKLRASNQITNKGRPNWEDNPQQEIFVGRYEPEQLPFVL